MNSFGQVDQSVETCDCCGADAARLVRERVPFLYGDEGNAVTLYADMPVWSCDACGERYTAEGAEEAERDAICTHLGRLTPAEILSARQRAGLTQSELAEALGVGRVSVARWETGQQLQSGIYDSIVRAWIQSREVLYQSHLFGDPVFRTDVRSRRVAAEAFMLIAA